MDCKNNQDKIKELNMDYEKLKTKRQNHIRLKGIGSRVFLKNYDNVLDIYKKMYKGIPFDFDLTKGTVKFDIQNMNSIRQKTSFTRTVLFGNKAQKEELKKLKKVSNFIAN